MKRRIYISSDYDEGNGDRAVVEEFYKWNESNRHSLEFSDLAKVVSGSVSNCSDCRICDLKAEFNRQINLSSAIIFVVGDRTKNRTAGSMCDRHKKASYVDSQCTPYKQNSKGSQPCKVIHNSNVSSSSDVSKINGFSYLRHEFEQAKKKGKKIIIVYNSLYRQEVWLPPYMSEFADLAIPFWIKTNAGNKIGNYEAIKDMLEL